MKGTNMPFCQAHGCSNQTKKGLSFHRFPDITKEKERAERWLHNMGTTSTPKTFQFNKFKYVCGDHFHPDCYEENLQAKMLGYKAAKKLKPGAIPSLFKHKTYDIINMDGTSATTRPMLNKRKRNEENEVTEKPG